jgi:hypothetical protein
MPFAQLEWIDLVSKVGVPLTSLIVVLYFVYKFALYIDEKWLSPFRTQLLARLMKFFDDLDMTIHALQRVVETQAAVILKMETSHYETKAIIERLRDEMHGREGECRKFHERLDEEYAKIVEKL